MPPEDLHESATTHATSPAPRSKPVKRESWFEVVKTIVYALLIALGAELRGGQVVRARRTDLDFEHATFTVWGRGHKRGVVV